MEDKEVLHKQIRFLMKRQKYFRSEIRKFKIKRFFGLLSKKDYEKINRLNDEQISVIRMAKELFKRMYGIQALEAAEEAFGLRDEDLKKKFRKPGEMI